MNKNITIVFLILGSVLTSSLQAEVTEFGGHPARFKGKGDMQPPLCQIDIPRFVSNSFFVGWDCSDNQSSPDELRSELWIVKKNSPIPYKVGDFLGFPASVKVEKAHLADFTNISSEAEKYELLNNDFEYFLPINVRLLVRDRSGNASLSPVIEVNHSSLNSGITDNDSSLNISMCSIFARTRPIPASIDFTGIPALFAETNTFPANLSSTISGNRVIRNSEPLSFIRCEIETLCMDSMNLYNMQILTDNSGTKLRLNSLGSQNTVSINLTKAQNSNGSSLAYEGSSSLSLNQITDFFVSCN